MTNSGWAGTVTELDYAQAAALTTYDTVADSAAWAVTPGTGRAVNVAANGQAFAKGVLSKDLGTLSAALATPTNGVFYLIVRRINWETKSVSVVAIPHTTTTTTTPTAAPSTLPAVQSAPGVSYDHVLAWAWVNSVTTAVTVFDLRKLPLDSRLAAVEVDTGWISFPDFQNGFTAGSVAPAYRRRNGVVYLRGNLWRASAPGAAVLPVTTLPVGFRPDTSVIITTHLGWSAFCEVQGNGSVSYAATTIRSSGVGYPLGGVSYIPSGF